MKQTAATPAHPPEREPAGGSVPAFSVTAWRLGGAAVGTLLVTSLADLIFGILRAHASRPELRDVAWAWLYVVALMLPFALALGLGLAGALLIVRRTPWLSPLLVATGSARALFRHNSTGFATTLAAGSGAALAFVSLWRLAEHFATQYHDSTLASAAMAASALGVFALATLTVAGLSLMLRPFARLLGAFASVGAASVLMLGVVVAAGAHVLSRIPALLTLVSPFRLGLAAVTLIVFSGLALLIGRRRLAFGRPRTALSVLILICTGLWLFAGASYGDSHEVRTLVERRTGLGLTMVRGYRRLTDRDHDGFSFAFGGDDCDDSRADVHPGAPDEPGDGVDADCFAGDGSPNVADLSDGHYADRPAGLRDKPNIVIISVDALRPDHLGFSGYERPVSPRMDELLGQSVVFDQALAQSTRSMLSIPSLFTGRYPSQIAFGPQYLWPALEPSNKTVAESLAQAGYTTSVVMGTNYFDRVEGFFQGFNRKQRAPAYHPARGWVADHAVAELGTLAQTARPFLLWAHFFNVHQPYLHDHRPSRFGSAPMDAYDTEIAYADAEVARVLDALEEHDLMDNTIVVLASDHGEAFGEHGERYHANALYDEELRSTLAIRVPGMSPRRVSAPVGLLDLTPTLLNLANVPMPSETPARSLVGLLSRDEAWPNERLLFAELMPDGRDGYDQKCIRRNGTKLIWWVQDGSFEFFDLSADPEERQDLSAERPDEARESLGLLRAWVAQVSRPENRTDHVIAEARLSEPPSTLTERLDLSLPGHFTLLGYEQERSSYRLGQPIAITLYYRVDHETTDDLTFHIKVAGPPGYRVPAHFDAYHLPLNGRYRTPHWQAGEILRDPIELVIPRSIQRPVALRLRLEVRNGRRPLAFADGRVEIPLGEINIR